LLVLVLVLLLLPAAAAAATSSPNLLLAGRSGQHMQYFIDGESIRQERGQVRYLLIGHSVGETRGTTYEGEIGADCSRGLRIEFVGVTRWAGGVRTNRQPDPAPVAPGSREAEELTMACSLAQQPGYPTTPPAWNAALAPIRWTGTAFAIDRDLVVTSNHVVRGCPRLHVVQGQMMHVATVVASDPASDLAALTIRADSLQPSPVAYRPRQLGETVVVLGYPLAKFLGSSLRVTAGIVSSLAGVQDEPGSIQISAPIQPGNSGGPVVGGNGEVVGVVTKRLDVRLGAENVNFAVNAQQLHDFLERFRLPHQMAPPKDASRLPIPDVVRKAAPSVHLVLCG
jgi:S1-C subfamily serine protease